VVSAISETEFIHSPNHPNSSAVTFRLALRQKTKVRDFRRNEQHRGGIWASRHAGAACDTGGRFHREIRTMLWYWQRIRFRGGSCSSHNVASSFDDLIEGAAVNHEILDRWKSRGAEWLDPDCVSIGKSSHLNLAGGSLARSVWNAVDDQRTCSADTLATVRIKSDRIFADSYQCFIHYVEHLKK
jgi:hypothetical protein